MALKIVERIRRRQESYRLNREAIDALEAKGIEVVQRGSQSALIKQRWLVYFFTNVYMDLKTEQRGTFDPGKFDFIKLPGRPKKQDQE